jgi:hypothetical protein
MNVTELRRPRIAAPGEGELDRLNGKDANYAEWTLYLQRRLSIVAGFLSMGEKIDSTQTQACIDMINEIRCDLTPVVEFCDQVEEFLEDA